MTRVLVLSILLSAGAFVACGGSGGDDTATSGTGGKSGSSGGQAGTAAAGKGGAGAGQAGAAGSSGGKAGASGTAGGAAGSAGTGGKSGASGAGQAGAAGAQGGAGGSKAGAAGAQGGSAGGGAAGSTSGNAGAAGSGTCQVLSVVVSPPSQTITITNGAVTTASYQAKAVCGDGTIVPVPATFSFSAPDVALIGSGSGVLTPNGKKGGKGTVTATYMGKSGTADAIVKLVVTDTGGVSPGDQAKLDGGGSGPSATIVYPYDQTVFARGILQPEIMWDGGAAGDAWLVHLTEDYLDAKLYLTADPPSRLTMSDALWAALTASNHGESVAVSLTRLSGGQAGQPVKQSWKIAQGSLKGTIYYWAVNTGQIQKILPGASSPVPAFDTGPFDQLGTPAPANYNGANPPWESGGSGKRCVACHTVSKDGSTLAGIFEKQGSTASPWGTVDTTSGQMKQISPYSDDQIFLTLSPDGKYSVVNNVGFRLRLADASNGAPIGSALDAFPDNAADPMFAPSGKMVAFASNVSGAYPVEYSASGLDVVDFDAATTSVSNRRTIVPGDGSAIAFPSFAPGSDFLVFQRGNYSRANYGSGLHGIDDLYVAGATPGAAVIPLDAANGKGVLPDKDLHRNYEPRVNPIAVGGYMWVVFVSPRTYGNRMVATNDASYDNRKQLWVAAVDLDPQPGKDPSHPAFLLRGQDLQTINMSGYWSLAACQQDGASCEEGFECCSGFCRDDNGKLTCSPPPGGCSKIGEKCSTAADCCDQGASCIGGFCAQGKP